MSEIQENQDKPTANMLVSFLINEMGITKKYLNERVDKIATSMIERRVHSQSFDDMVRQSVNRALQDPGSWSGYDKLNEAAKAVVVKHIQEVVTKNLSISVEGFVGK